MSSRHSRSNNALKEIIKNPEIEKKYSSEAGVEYFLNWDVAYIFKKKVFKHTNKNLATKIMNTLYITNAALAHNQLCSQLKWREQKFRHPSPQNSLL